MRRAQRRGAWTWFAANTLALVAVLLAQFDEDLAYFGRLRLGGYGGSHMALRWFCIIGAYAAIWACYWLGVHRGQVRR